MVKITESIPESVFQDRLEFARAYVEKVGGVDFSPDTYKSHFRGVATPGLTRLHFFRSGEDRWVPAPNWGAMLEAPDRLRFAALVAKDFMVNRLGWPYDEANSTSLQSFIGQIPHGRRGNSAKERGNTFDSYLQQEDGVRSRQNPEGGHIMTLKSKIPSPKVVYDALNNAIGNRRLVGMDQIRSSILKTLRSEGIVMASFSLDRMLIAVAREQPDIVPLRGSSAALDSLVAGGNAYSAMKKVPT